MQKNLPIQLREAVFVPATLNEADRTVEVVWTTGAKVRRYDFWEGRAYFEELDLSPEAVDLSRLNAGAPLLNAHRASDTADVVGVVEKSWLTPTEGRAIVRFSARADVAPLLADVKDGILRNISVGYSVEKYLVTEEGDSKTYRAAHWTPMELSLVPIPADAGAGTRSAAQHPVRIQFYRPSPHGGPHAHSTTGGLVRHQSRRRPRRGRPRRARPRLGNRHPVRKVQGQRTAQ